MNQPTKEQKELNEAREAIIEILASCLSDNDVRPRADEILNLKGDRWELRVVPLKPKCPHCDSRHTQKYGQRKQLSEIKQRYWCYDCGHIFYKPVEIL